MPRMENNGGDALARGASSFTFKPAGLNKTEEEWNAIFADYDSTAAIKGVYLFKCEQHGVFQSDREVYLRGGFPLLDEKYATGKCPKCEEKSAYAGFQPDENVEVTAVTVIDKRTKITEDDSDIPF